MKTTESALTCGTKRWTEEAFAGVMLINILILLQRMDVDTKPFLEIVRRILLRRRRLWHRHWQKSIFDVF